MTPDCPAGFRTTLSHDLSSTAARVRRLVLPLVAVAGAAVLLTGCSSSVSSSASPAGSLAYVATGAGLADPGNSVVVVDTATKHVLDPIVTGPSTTATLPAAFAATPDGKDVLVAEKGANQLSVIDTATGKVTRHVSVGLEPDAVAVTPDGSLALVAEFGSSTVTPVTLPSLTVGRPIPVGRQPVAIAIAPNGRLAVVADFQDGTVTPITLPTMAPEAPLAAGMEPSAVVVSPDSGTALVADFQTSQVTPIDLTTGATRPSIPVAGNPTGIAVWKSGTMAWVSGGNSLTPIELGSLRAGSALPVGTTVQALALADGGRTAWVCGGNGKLVPINLASGSVGRSVTVGGQPTAIVIPVPGPARTPRSVVR